MCWPSRCENVTTDQFGKFDFYVPLKVPKDVVVLKLKVLFISIFLKQETLERDESRDRRDMFEI